MWNLTESTFEERCRPSSDLVKIVLIGIAQHVSQFTVMLGRWSVYDNDWAQPSGRSVR